MAELFNNDIHLEQAKGIAGMEDDFPNSTALGQLHATIALVNELRKVRETLERMDLNAERRHKERSWDDL